MWAFWAWVACEEPSLRVTDFPSCPRTPDDVCARTPRLVARVMPSDAPARRRQQAAAGYLVFMPLDHVVSPEAIFMAGVCRHL